MLHQAVAELCVAVDWNSIFFATKCRLPRRSRLCIKPHQLFHQHQLL